ncbi:hypothetical protein NQ315_002033 [Exocentrus adspersus]|uniref:Rotatin N-terminal domain-containing protein n=1 Tax=Exocentrus adspersus TaxID=1586481 RepID=A0AAV8V9Y8_9CUCU|nr:hypothetical protein NQ315_002033 [Exocentrus adspersus]
MTAAEDTISSHIQKLGHSILEIRERALFNVVSKLENSSLLEGDPGRGRDLLTRLFQWFLFEPCTQEEVVFSLLKLILKSESGGIIINHYGVAAIKTEIHRLRSYLDPKYFSHLDELNKIIDERVQIKASSEAVTPLSYRAGTNDTHDFYSRTNSSESVITTTFDKCEQRETTFGAQTGFQNWSYKNSKLSLLTQPNSAPISSKSSVQSLEQEQVSEPVENLEDILELKRNQLSLPTFCCKTLIKVFEYLCIKKDSVGNDEFTLNMVGINYCLCILEDVFYIFFFTFGKDTWDMEQSEISLTVLREFNEMLIRYGETLEYFRMKCVFSERNSAYRLIYFYLTHNVSLLLKHLIPESKMSIILPRNLKCALSNSLLDVLLRTLYPEAHETILNYVKGFNDNTERESLTKYENVTLICNGMSATIRFLKQYETLTISKGLKLAKEALPSIEFHANFELLKGLVDMCSSKFHQLADSNEMIETVEDVVLNLLSHNLISIKKEVYRLCHRIILNHIGPEANLDLKGSQILFLLNPKILINITVFGMTNQDLDIKRYAKDILLYILKCRILVSEEAWNKIVQALIPALPVLVCHCSKDVTLGNALLTLIDPDVAEENQAYLRSDAFSRICWLLTSSERLRGSLPRFKAVFDSSLANVCYVKATVDVNKSRTTDHFYQPTSLRQVMEILKSENLEPAVRRSALNQVSVMLEDPLLHQVFLEMNGIVLMIKIMKTALIGREYKDYPDSIIPITSVMKNICFYHSNVREELSMDIEVFYCLLQGLFLYFTEERMQQDCATLLCLLIFKDFIRGTPSNASFSLPALMRNNLQLPFLCNTHWEVSDYANESLKNVISSDPWCLASVRIQWNLEIFGGAQELMKANDINYDKVKLDFPHELKLNNSDLRALKNYLDALLSSLVHLSADLNWSKGNYNQKNVMQRLITVLCEFIEVFHCGKGSYAAVSVMGLSITRNVLVILNNLIAELQHTKVKFWEKYFFNDLGGISVKSFLSLWTSRDVIVRAGALQLFCNLTTTVRVCAEILREEDHLDQSILDLSFAVLVDDCEADIVREYAAYLLANIVSHLTPSDKMVHSNFPLDKNYTNKLLHLIQEYNVYLCLETIFNNGFTLKLPVNNSEDSIYELYKKASVNATPGLLKAAGVCLHNFLILAPEDVIMKLQEYDLVKLLFRSICNPSRIISSARDLSLYCDILEMDAVLCSALTKVSSSSPTSTETLIYACDCFNVLISLLDSKHFRLDLPHLIYLRNELWVEIFHLLTTLLECGCGNNEDAPHDKSVEVVTIFCQALSESKCKPFLETVYESISSIGFTRLQNSALVFLASLLKFEAYKNFNKSNPGTNIPEKYCLQNVFDSFSAPRSAVMRCKTQNRKINTRFDKKENYFDVALSNWEDKAKYDYDGIYFIENNNSDLIAGAEFCKMLIYLYNTTISKNKDVCSKNKENITSALTGLLCISEEAKNYALETNFLNVLIKQLNEKHIQLSLDSVECLRRTMDKKRICPLLNNVNDIINLVTNFMIANDAVKTEATALGLAHVVHKLWIWFLTNHSYLIDVLRLLSVYTAECALGCQSLTLTSSIAGCGARKTPSSVSLLHDLITLVVKEMERVSKTHDLTVLALSLNIMCNCCKSLECRILFSKSNLFSGLLRLRPDITKRQKPWDSVESMWLEFLQTFTLYPEGQMCVPKSCDILEITTSLILNAKPENKAMSLLLSAGEFLNILQAGLVNGTVKEINILVVVIWALVANNQRAKIIFKSAHLDAVLEDIVKRYQFLEHGALSEVDFNRIAAVLNMLRNDN